MGDRDRACCPCGYFSDPKRECICSPERIQKYISKLSGPVLDRIDLHVEVGRVALEEIAATELPERSAAVAARVAEARLGHRVDHI